MLTLSPPTLRVTLTTGGGRLVLSPAVSSVIQLAVATALVGASGASAYEIAVDEGFVGDEAAWLASLQGPAGADGADGSNGADGADGADGASAYEVAVANGFVGTEAEWLASLQGEQGEQGEQGVPGEDGEQGPPGQVLTDATSAATAYTLTPSDHMKHIRFSAATLVIVTLDAGSLAANFYCELRQDNTGQVQVVQGTGTLRTDGTAKTRALYSVLRVFGTSANIGYVNGGMAAA